MKIINKRIKSWYRISDKIRFALVGCVNAGIMYFIYAVFVLILGEKLYQAALIFAWILSSLTSFFMHKIFVFCSKGNIFKEYMKCCSTWVISYGINAIFLEALVKYLKLNVYISQIIAPAIAGIFTYFIFKKFAFKKTEKQKK